MLNRMVIPTEAVEAAARALRDKYAAEVTELPVSSFSSDALGALEAALPYIAATAWDEGMRWANALQSGEDLSNNPYRSAAQ